MSTDAGYGRNVSDEHSGKYRVLGTAIGARIDTIERGHKRGHETPISSPNLD